MRVKRMAGAAALTVVIMLLASCGMLDGGSEAAPTTPAIKGNASGTLTLQSMIDEAPETPEIELGASVRGFGDDVAVPIMYTSGGLKISGLLRIPSGDGPFPAVVLVHGGVDPAKYQSGDDLVHEQRALVQSGYAVLATDLRGYGRSDPPRTDALAVDPGFGWFVALDWGMALDVVNALRILRDGLIDSVDPERVGLIGHSLGGLLSLDAAVIAPEAADVVVALSAPSSWMWDSITHAVPADSPEFSAIVDKYGTPETNPDYWEEVSPRTYADRMTAPLTLIHGGADRAAPPQWSEDTEQAWQRAGSTARAIIVQGTNHALRPHRDQVIAHTMEAINSALKK